ncbi:MAG: hypothetical protein DU429_00440 [Candidatus Tokpelaia sp.]|nr:MAG: hypothetical protein DU429_00440 [Candidatus Tokpelaia sp.]
MGRALGQTATQAYRDQYNRDQQNKLAANAQMDNARNQAAQTSLALGLGQMRAGGVSDDLAQTQLDANAQK